MWSWRIGSIKGIDLKIHITFPLVLIWAAMQFGGAQQNGLFALFGAFMVLLLFICVLLHELGHALAAQHYGITVEDITLLPIGGLAKLRMLRDDARQELVIALAGPLVNVAISLLLLPVLLWVVDIWDSGTLSRVAARSGTSEWWAAVLLLARSARSISLEGLLSYLFFANLMLALFNLVPAFPLDGGRIFRAFLAMVLPYRLATTLAVRIGQALALLFVIVGFRSNPGLVLIALFVFISGAAELRRVALREILVQGKVGHYMVRALQPLYPQWSLYAARLLAQQTGQRAFPVIEGGRLLGLLSVREMQRPAETLTVGDAMVKGYSVLSPAGTLYDAQVELQGNDHFAGAVMEDDVLLGLLSLEDIERGYHSLQRQPRVQLA